MPITQHLHIVPLGAVPMPQTFERRYSGSGPRRCEMWPQVAGGLLDSMPEADRQGLDLNSPQVLRHFMDVYGKQGAAAGCPWHQMHDAAAVVAASVRLVSSHKGSSDQQFLAALRAEQTGVHPGDQAALERFVLEPIEIQMDGQVLRLAAGAHRICALRAALPLRTPVVVRADPADLVRALDGWSR